MANQKPTVFICTPHGEKVTPAFNRHIMEMQNASLDYLYMQAEVETLIVGLARNMLVEISQQHDADVILFIDNDVLVPPHAHTLIDRALERGIVSGIYFARRPPYTPQIFNLAEGKAFEEQQLYWPSMEIPDPEKSLTEADAVGFGCVAVRMDVFISMVEYHVKKFEYASDLLMEEARKSPNKNLESIAFIVKHLSPWFEFLNKRGEDIYFCERAIEAGHTVWVDPSVMCLHMGDIPIGVEHFTYLKENDLINIIEPVDAGHQPADSSQATKEVEEVSS